MSRRRRADRTTPVPAAHPAPPKPRAPLTWPWRGLGFLALVLLALLGARGAIRLWDRETTVGSARPLLARHQDSPEIIQALRRVVLANPDDGEAMYLLGSTLVRQEHKKWFLQGTTRDVDLGVLDEAVQGLLDHCLRTYELPYRAFLAMGQAQLFGAEISKAENRTEAVQPFALGGMAGFLRALRINPTPQANTPDLWIEAARAANMAGRPDGVLYALLRVSRDATGSPTPAFAAQIPLLEQNAAVDLANAPLVVDRIGERWIANPEDRETWKQMFLVGTLGGGETASRYLLDQVLARFPNDPLARELNRRVRETPAPGSGPL